MLAYSFIFSLLIFWLDLFFFSAFAPIWQINILLVLSLLAAIFSGKIPWPLILLTAFWESLNLPYVFFGSILITQALAWLVIEILLETLKPVNTKITVITFIFFSTAIYSVFLKILSFITLGRVDLNFILITALINGLLALLAWSGADKIRRASRKWLLIKAQLR